MTEEALKERKEGLLALMEDPSYKPMKLKELSMLLNVPRERREELKEVLDALIADGKIVLSKRGKYGRPEKKILTGTFSGSSRGFGFVVLEGGPAGYLYSGGISTGMPCTETRCRLRQNRPEPDADRRER